MKEIDDTPLPENESEPTIQDLIEWQQAINDKVAKKLRELAIRIANLETQRTPQDENDDPEWY